MREAAGAELPHSVGVERIGVHFHDTYGQALTNTLTALRAGVSVVDASTYSVLGSTEIVRRVGGKQTAKLSAPAFATPPAGTRSTCAVRVTRRSG